jgi:hypothetical protein
MEPASDIIQCHSYSGYIPDYTERELARLHAGRYSSLPHFEIYGLADQASTYIASRGEQPTTLLLYRRNGAIVRVLNEGIPISVDDARRFADHIFRQDNFSGAILFRAVDMPATPPDVRIQRVPCEQDSVLPLPASQGAYLNSLGAGTRSLVKNRLNKIRREHPGFEFRIAERGQVDPQHVHAILALHRQRAHSGVWRKAIHLDSDEEARVMQMVARCGMVGVALVDGRCIGGSICYRNGDVVSARFLAHDPAYDLYRLGFLCAWLMCNACAGRSDIRQFNFGWGKEPYKAHLGGRVRTLSDVAIYRSKGHRLRMAPLSLGLTLRGWQFQLRKLAQRFRK